MESTARPIIQTDLQGKLVARHESIKGAAKSLDVFPGTISKILKGDRKSTKGYTFKYEDGKPQIKTGYSNKAKPILLFQSDYSGEKFLQECRSSTHCEKVIGLKSARVRSVLKTKSRKYENYFLIYKQEFIEYFPSGCTKREHILNNFQNEPFNEHTIYYIMHNENLQNIIKFVTTGKDVHCQTSGALHNRVQNNSLLSKDLAKFVPSAALT